MLTMLCAPDVAAAQAQPGPDAAKSAWYVQVGTYDHYRNKEEYRGSRLFGGVEYSREDWPIIGFSIFSNSFGNPAQYAYLAKKWNPWDEHPAVRIKVSLGVVHGYEGENHKILPIRWGDAWGIGLVPTIGYQRDRVGIDLGLLSASGVIFLLGCEF